ncbi:MAG: hypothetical protein ACYSR7_03245 [Planctomycetota bacterium]|jgi:hypothetical protein
MEYKESQFTNALPGYSENSVLKPMLFYHSDLQDSLESIVTKEKPETSGLLGKVFADKSKTQKATVKALFNEVTLREKMNLHLLNKIDEDMSKQCTDLSNLKTSSFTYSPDIHKELNNKKMQLQNRVLELEQEKRKEYLECWRDLMFLKKYLFMALKDYWDLSNRKSALAFDPGNLMENDKGKGY